MSARQMCSIPNIKMVTKFTDQTTTGIDANDTDSVTVGLDIKSNDFVSFQIIANTGGNTTHILTLQCSLNNSTWQNTSSTITGVGLLDNIQVSARFIRVKVTTAEGGASTVDVLINAK